MSELDKFKRRTIRSVARLLLEEKKHPEELWREMKKETGTDCRVLWERMRALCVKKLNRMIAVDDRSASLPSIARLSLTDWLLVDLVLVHEKIDVIAMEKCESKEPPALVELFNLVQRFDVEGRSGDMLAECWAAATVFYNRQGRQCSPMLLQRRWYQLKKLTRCRFYKFWFSYKGNYRLLAEARKSMPTRLQMAIARRYPKVITGEFPDWEEQIQKRLIIMPEEFEAKMRLPNLPKPCNSNDPDLVLVEPVVETIDLRIDSDPEDHNNDLMDDPSDPEISNDAADMTNPAIEEQSIDNNDALGIKIKSEPVEEDGLSNVQLISATHVPEVEIPDDSPEESNGSKPPSEMDSEGIGERQIDNSPGDDDDVIVLPTVVPTVDVDSELPTVNMAETAATEVPSIDISVASEVVPINDIDEVVDDIIKIKADEFCRKATEVPVEKPVTSEIDDLIKDKIDSFLKTPKEDDKKPDIGSIDLTKNKALEVTAVDLMADLNFVDDGIEFVDDGVEFVEEDDVQEIESTDKTSSADQSNENGQSKENVEETNKFDLKLLMNPVVYTTKLDQMKIFTNKPYYTVVTKEDIEMAALESKPVSKKSFDINVKQESVTSVDDATNDEISDSEEDLYEMVPIVSHSSYMLKKPKTRSYDPIKLCKNPDFNTKLKRLTIGFLSSTRNRQLLNACIPMTIDLSKAFESKLVDNTLHLQSSGNALKAVKQEVIDKQATSMIPTAMPVQSLMDNSKTDIQNLISNQSPVVTDPIVAERNKIINLPDIDKVRRLNQQLLTAQVPPLRVYSGNSNQPRPLPAPVPSAVEVLKKLTPELQPIATEPATMPTIISVESTSNTALVPQSTMTAKVKVENEKEDQKETDTIIKPPETLPPAKQKLVKMINQAKISTQEALAKIDSGNTEFPKPIVVNKVKAAVPQEVPKKYGFPRVPVAWAPKYAQVSEKLDDFLLTNDTLNKMLHLMMSGEKDVKDCNCCSIKPAKKSKVKRKALPTEMKQNETDTSNSEQKEKKTEPPNKKKTVSEKPPSAKTAKDSLPEGAANKAVIAQGRVVKYCCWAKQKLCNRKRITRHLCLPDECKCCCRDQLAARLMEADEMRKSNEYKTSTELENTRILMEQNTMRNAIASIENVVQQSRDDLNSTDTPNVVGACIDVDSIPDSSESPKKVYINIDLSPPTLHQNATTPTKPPRVITKVRAAPDNFGSYAKKILETRVKQLNSQPQPAQSSLGSRTACSCQTPAVSLDSQRNIIIDASKKCALHPTPIAPKQDKILYLHSKSLAKSPSESPIFLGKNKILLTTVKFPRRNEEVVEIQPVQSAKIIPTLALPAGVQLVLLPSGVVTYTLDPGVELDEAQLATLPAIISAVQQQLNAGVPAPAAPIVDPQISAPENNLQPVIDAPQPEIGVSENTQLPQTEGNLASDTTEQQIRDGNITETPELHPPISLETDEVFRDAELPTKNIDIDAVADQPTAVPPEQATTPSAEDTNKNTIIDPEAPKDNANNDQSSVPDKTPSVSEPEVVQIEKEIETIIETQTNDSETTNIRKEPSDNEGVNNRKTLLSDLMEMSGISAEDATAPEPPPPEPPIEKPTTIPDINMINSEQSRNLPELSPVTSFAELKYACEQNGKFFKLDFETGVIVSINVCIKKNPKNKMPPKTKEFIDLTDDADNTEIRKSTQLQKTMISPPLSHLGSVSQYLYRGQTLNIPDTVKPVKLFQAFRPQASLLKRPAITELFGPPLSRRKTHIEKRKQNLNKIEAKIDLVDSDEPMEEEYLMTSSDDDSQTGREPMLVEALNLVEALDPSLLEDSDSSDDEPLAKKSKRLKEDTVKDDVRETNIYDEIPEIVPKLSETVGVVSVRKDLGIPIDRPSVEMSVNPAPIPPSQLSDPPSTSVMNENHSDLNVGPTDEDRQEFEELDKDVSPELRLFSVSDGEGSEEDCILGV